MYGPSGGVWFAVMHRYGWNGNENQFLNPHPWQLWRIPNFLGYDPKHRLNTHLSYKDNVVGPMG